MRIPYISMVAAGALALGGCAYGDYGYGYSSPYYSYGYGTPYYGGYGTPYYGWYDNFYYPGSGYYVYDSYRRPYAMTTTQRAYWSTRSPALRVSGTRTRVRENWSSFNHHSTTRTEERRRRQND